MKIKLPSLKFLRRNSKTNVITLADVLTNAIKMQAVSSGGRLRVI